MPWECECQLLQPDSVTTCTACGETKHNWSLYPGQSEVLVIRRGLTVQPGDPSKRGQETFLARWTTKAHASYLVAEGRTPDLRDLLLVEISGRPNQQFELKVELDLGSDGVTDQTLALDGGEDQSLLVPLLLVHGPGPLPATTVEGVYLIDATSPQGNLAEAVTVAVKQGMTEIEIEVTPERRPVHQRVSAGEPYPLVVKAMIPGDTVEFAQGSYRQGLSIWDKHGDKDARFTFVGEGYAEPRGLPAQKPAATFVASTSQNNGKTTISLMNSSFVTVRGFTLDGQDLTLSAVKSHTRDDLAGLADTAGERTTAEIRNQGPEAYAKTAQPVFDVVVEDLWIHDYSGDRNNASHTDGQQAVGISTKCPAWDWTIRNNRVESAGTGIYLGNSEGDMPFVRGTIEGNHVIDPEGYGMEIKHQFAKYWPTGPKLPPAGRSTTTIRGNRFEKTNRPSRGGDRPALLVGGPTDSGPGSEAVFVIEDNYVRGNRREAAFQGTGRLVLVGNTFAASRYGIVFPYVHHGKKVINEQRTRNRFQDCEQDVHQPGLTEHYGEKVAKKILGGRTRPGNDAQERQLGELEDAEQRDRTPR